LLAERRVLVVDDEAAICELVTEVFEDWPNTRVVCSHDGVDAVMLLQAGKFDLCLTDVELPGLSGLTVAGAAVNDDTPVLILAGHPDMGVKLALVDLPHLPKPFGMAELLRESQIAVADSKNNVVRVRAALEILKTRAGALQTAVEESRRLLGESMVASARAGGRASKYDYGQGRILRMRRIETTLRRMTRAGDTDVRRQEAKRELSPACAVV
jgi:CheY-like chemotaxis protein